MTEFFFGTWGVVAWALMCAVFAFVATYMWLIVIEVGGIRGAALGILFTGCAITTGGFSLLLSDSSMISSYVVGAIITASWWPMVLAAFVLADLYAADRNSHRSFTTRSYLWFKRVTRGNEDEQQFTA